MWPLATGPGLPCGCVWASRSWRRNYVPEGLGPGASYCGESLPWPWQDLRALPGLLLNPVLSVLPKRIVEEIPSPNTETKDEVALGEVTLDRPQTATTLQSQSPKPEKVLRSRLVGLLIWGFVVLIASVATV